MRIYDLFHVLLLTQDSTKKNQSIQKHHSYCFIVLSTDKNIKLWQFAIA